MKEFLIYLNDNYSGLLAVVVAFITAIITLAYVIMTYKQVKLSKISVESVEKQIKLNSQPCIIPKIIKSIGTECFTETRRQLHIKINLSNVGNSPAINIYTIGFFELSYTQNGDGSNVKMFYYPDYIPILANQDNSEASIRFEEKEISLLIKDLEIKYELNIERVRSNPYKPAFRGTNLIIKVYYKNLLGQWFEATLIQEVGCLIENSDDKDKDIIANKSHDHKRYNIPPNALKKDTQFRLQLMSERLSPVDIRLIDIDVVKGIMRQYEAELPGFNRFLN